MNLIAHIWTTGKKKPVIANGFCIYLDFVRVLIGGAAGVEQTI